MLAEVDPSLRPHVETEINDYASRSRAQIQDNVYTKEMNEHASTIYTSVEGMREDALQAARLGDPDMYNKKIAAIAEATKLGIEQNILDPLKVAAAAEAFSEKIDEQLVLGSFDRIIDIDNLDAARKELEKFKKSKNEDLLPATKDQVVKKIQAKINTYQAEINRNNAIAKATKTAEDKALKLLVDDATVSLDKGKIPPDLETVIDLVSGTKYEDQFRESLVHAAATNEFLHLSPLEQEQQINKIKEKKVLSKTQIALLERQEKIHEHTKTELKNDGLSLAVEQGFINITPIDFQDLSSIQNRIRSTQRAEAQYKQDISPLTDTETTQLAESLNVMSADEKIGLLNAVVGGFGDYSHEVLKNLDKKNYNLYAYAGNLINDGAPDVARLAILGNEQMQLNKGILPADTDLMPEIRDYIGTVFISNPKHQASVIETTKAVYAAMAANQGEISGVLNTDILNSALEKVTGGILDIEINGSGIFVDDTFKIQAPARGVTKTMFEKYIKELRPGDIEEMGGVLAFSLKESIERIQGAVLENAGQGKYLVNIGNGYLLKPNGDPFEFIYGVKGVGTIIEEQDQLEVAPITDKKVVTIDETVTFEGPNAKNRYGVKSRGGK